MATKKKIPGTVDIDNFRSMINQAAIAQAVKDVEEKYKEEIAGLKKKVIDTNRVYKALASAEEKLMAMRDLLDELGATLDSWNTLVEDVLTVRSARATMNQSYDKLEKMLDQAWGKIEKYV